MASTLTVLSACTDVRPTPTDAEWPSRADARAEPQSADPAEPLVRGLAIALSDSGVRRQFWEHLRDSPFPNHRLHLKSYLQGSAGERVLEAAADAAQVSRARLLAVVESLPEMEIVVPAELDRLRWTGTPDVVVAGTALPKADIARRATLTGYTTGGRSVTIPLYSPVPFPQVILIPTQTEFGSDPEARRARAPRRARGTISTKQEEFTVTADECVDDPTNPVDDCGSIGIGPNDHGLVIPSSMTYACFVAAYSTGDVDGDGLLDNCEHEIAYAFRPYLAASYNNSWEDLRREEYWTVRRGDIERSVQVLYALSYYLDKGDSQCGGCKGHIGDSEWIIVQVQYNHPYWLVERAKLSAHWNTSAESTQTVDWSDLEWPDGRKQGRVGVWVAQGKHANYKSKHTCGNGGFLDFDTCWDGYYRIGNSAAEVEVLASANLGNSWHPLKDFVVSREGGGVVGGNEAYWTVKNFGGWQGSAWEMAGPYRYVFDAHSY